MANVDPATWSEATVLQLRDEFKSFILAGHETSASMMTWCVYQLAMNPDALSKVRQSFISLSLYILSTYNVYLCIYVSLCISVSSKYVSVCFCVSICLSSHIFDPLSLLTFSLLFCCISFFSLGYMGAYLRICMYRFVMKVNKCLKNVWLMAMTLPTVWTSSRDRLCRDATYVLHIIHIYMYGYICSSI